MSDILKGNSEETELIPVEDLKRGNQFRIRGSEGDINILVDIDPIEVKLYDNENMMVIRVPMTKFREEFELSPMQDVRAQQILSANWIVECEGDLEKAYIRGKFTDGGILLLDEITGMPVKVVDFEVILNESKKYMLCPNQENPLSVKSNVNKFGKKAILVVDRTMNPLGASQEAKDHPIWHDPKEIPPQFK